jgi:tRNA dimethylallyltransferase
MQANEGKVVAILGPTCTGKSQLAEWLAEELAGEIINTDSMQVYRAFNIGTAKPGDEAQARIKHHLIDIVEPTDTFDVARFKELADAAIRDVWSRGRIPITVGGSGLYLRVLFHGIFSTPSSEDIRAELRERYNAAPADVYEELKSVDPHYALRISHRDRVRVVRALEIFRVSGRTMSEWERDHGFREERYQVCRIGLMRERQELYDRINARVEAMLLQGWVDEVRAMLAAGYDPSCKPFSSIGYKEILLHLGGIIGYGEMVARIKQETRRYAKRQLTWFSKADGDSISWFRYPESLTDIWKEVDRFLRRST